MHPPDRNQIFRIEAYYMLGDLAQDPITVGKHGRLIYIKGSMNLSKLLDDEVAPQSVSKKGNMLVTGEFAINQFISTDSYLLVSANERVRDELYDLVQTRLDKIILLELDYQPAEKRRFWNSVWKSKARV